MATKEITKPESRYDDSDLEQELAVETERSARAGGRAAALLALLWHERRFLYRCAAYGLVFFTIIAFLLPVRYTSTARLMPPDQAGAGMATMLSALTKAGGELGAIGTDLLGIRTSSDLFVGVLHSRSIQDELINKFDLRQVYGLRRWEDARKKLEDSTEVSSDRKSEIITIKVTDKSPQRAAQLAHEYTSALNDIVLTLNVSSAHKERVFLEKRLGQVQQDLEAAEKDFGNFASKNTAIDVKEQGKAMIGAAAEIEGELIAAQTQLEGLRQIYNPNNVRVRSLQAQVDEYRKQLQKLGGKSQTTDSFVPPGSEDLYPSIRELPILGVQYADLYRRAKVQEAVFETLTKQYEMAKVEEARETPSVKILDDGDVPERKSFPPRLLIMLLGTIFIVVMGGVWLRAQERWQEIDSTSPGKILANDVSQTIRTRTNQLKRRLMGNHSDGFGFSRGDGDARDSKEQDIGRSNHDTRQ